MNKKILIISPAQTHPPYGGNRSSILNYSQYLTNMGFIVYFLYIGQALSKDSIELMTHYWGKRLIIITPRLYIWKIWLYKYFRFLQMGKVSYKIDDWFPWGVKHRIKAIQMAHKFDIIWVNYIWMSKALTFIKGARKVLDTHDVFSFRFEKTGNNWYSTSPNQGAKALNRGDFIITVQEKEGIFFEQLTLKNVVTTFRPFTYSQTPLCPMNNLLFIAGPNQHNIEGVMFLIKDVFPRLIQENPEIRLLIAGGICDVINKAILPDGMSLIGKIDILEEFYSMGNIVLNPVKQGTGLKIKTIEALSYGKILVTHPHNIIGVPYPDEIPVFKAETVEEYQKQIRALLQSENSIINTKELVYNYMKKYNDLVNIRMSRVLNLNN